jgi:heat shock protein HslJ
MEDGRMITMKAVAVKFRMLAAAALVMMGAACADSTGASLPAGPEVDASGSAVSASASDLLGSWRLVSLQEGAGPAEPVPAGTTFTAEFTSDGRLAARVDCNRCAGGFTAGQETLDVGDMACTRAYCTASAPYDTRYEAQLSSARAWTAQGGTLEIKSDRGVLKLAR